MSEPEQEDPTLRSRGEALAALRHLLDSLRRERCQVERALRAICAVNARDEREVHERILEVMSSELDYDRAAILVPTDARMAANFAVASVLGLEGEALGTLLARGFRRSELEASVPAALGADAFLMGRLRLRSRPERILVVGRSAALAPALAPLGEADRAALHALTAPIAAVLDHQLAVDDLRAERERLLASNAELRSRLER